MSSRLPVLPVPYKGDETSHNDLQIAPRGSHNHSRMEVLEERLMQQERTTQNLVDRAYKIKGDIIENLNYTHGSWQEEKHARELLQEHIRTITDVVRRLNRDIQTIDNEIRSKQNYVEGTSNAVKNLEVHHVAGLTDLRGRVARCDASISRLSADIKTCNDSIRMLAKQQQENQTKAFDRMQDLDIKISELVNKLERINNETIINLRHLEGGSNQQITSLEGKTVSMIDKTSSKVKALKAQEESERDRLETRLNTHLERTGNRLEVRVDKLEQKLDEIFSSLERRVQQLEDQAIKDRDRNKTSHQVLESKVHNTIDSYSKRQNAELSRLKQECREGFGAVHESISNMKQVLDGKRKLLEEQLKKEIGQIRKMVILV